MHQANKTHIVLLLIFTFSFCYRLLLMFREGFPPGADIGLHNSVIYSITGSGPADFFYNYYHIGGGVSLTFPGYHIFTSSVMLLTGMTGAYEYVAHALVVALFSSLTVLCAFLLTKKIWSTSAACIVAVLVAISRFDIEMIMWAGYPNVITLMLIPLTFYLYLQRERFSKLPFIASTSILVGSLFLTHSLSVGIFGAITVATLLIVLVAPKTLATTRKTAFYWILPIALGAVLVLPFLAQAVPAYLSDNAYLSGSSGSSVIGSATISARVLPLSIVIPLFGLIPAFIILSKKFYDRWLALPAFLLCVWVFVCLVFTQGYLVRIPFDYNRFLYFLVLPLIMFTGVLIDYGSETFAKIIDTYRSFTQRAPRVSHLRLYRFSLNLTRKNLYSAFVLFFLLFSFVAIPIFMTPSSTNVGLSIQSFYQTMNTKGWEALQWAKSNTASNAVFVADAEYGWWFGGFAQRPTLSGVDPQYLSLNREVDNATFARNLLDTDYIIDNGYVQVREDGGYLGRHNPEFLAKIRNEYYPYPFFNFDNDEIEIMLQNGTDTQIVYLSDVPVKDMHMESTLNSQSIVVTHGNGLFNYTQKVTVYAQSAMANLTVTLTATDPNVAFVSLRYSLHTKSSIAPVIGADNSNLGLVDTGMKTLGQLSFINPQSRPDYIMPSDASKDYSPVQLKYTLDLQTKVEFSFYMGTYQYTDEEYAQTGSGELTFEELVTQNAQAQLNKLQQLPANGQSDFAIFDYQKELVARSVSYVILFNNPEHLPRFVDDPLFSLVFINEEVAIFKVNSNLA
ncbi:MAG: hypothetical protein NWE96_01320 [Candidatus Bathyarchaeota archaeon]|nr:hypothetical protein [Candidatus Bathyarchaeota archaeon]